MLNITDASASSVYSNTAALSGTIGAVPPWTEFLFYDLGKKKHFTCTGVSVLNNSANVVTYSWDGVHTAGTLAAHQLFVNDYFRARGIWLQSVAGGDSCEIRAWDSSGHMKL